ncbi:MAG: hypothetical protein KDD56_04415 [Bdellovibrionales bacterium]|nr:hypothetical protein [Bdellovibrionales bacterium]
MTRDLSSQQGRSESFLVDLGLESVETRDAALEAVRVAINKYLAQNKTIEPVRVKVRVVNSDDERWYPEVNLQLENSEAKKRSIHLFFIELDETDIEGFGSIDLAETFSSVRLDERIKIFLEQHPGENLRKIEIDGRVEAAAGCSIMIIGGLLSVAN